MKGSKLTQQTQNQWKYRAQSFPYSHFRTLPDRATSGQLPGTSAAAVAVAAIVAVAVHLLDPAAGLLTPGWPVTVEGDGAGTAIGLIAFGKLGCPVLETVVAFVIVIVAAAVAVAAEAKQTVCCVNMEYNISLISKASKLVQSVARRSRFAHQESRLVANLSKHNQ